MKSPRHILPAALLTCTAALAVPSLASATDFCVDAPTGCTGTNVTAAGFPAALKAAEANGTDDRFFLAPGTFEGPFAYSSTERVEIEGAGAGTELHTSGAGLPLSLTGNPESKVEHL